MGNRFLTFGILEIRYYTDEERRHFASIEAMELNCHSKFLPAIL
jgi:hypothetical protein